MLQVHRRSISELVAVIMLVIIAVAAAVIIYAWISGLLGAARSSASAALAPKPSVSSASIYPNGTVLVQVFNPPGGSPTSVGLIMVTYVNYTMICYGSGSSLSAGARSIPPGSVANIYFTCPSSASVPPGTPVIITVFTASGTWFQYQATWPSS